VIDGRFFSRVETRKKVAALPILLSGLLLVTVLSSPLFGSTGQVSLPDSFPGVAQIEFDHVAGLSLNGQTISLDFFFPNPIALEAGSLWAELFLQTASSNSTIGDFPYSEYVVFGNSSTVTLIDETGNALNVSMSDGQDGITGSPAATLGSVWTDRGWAGAGFVAFPSADQRIAGIHFELTLPDTGQQIVIGRIGVGVDGETSAQTSQVAPDEAQPEPVKSETVPPETVPPETVPPETVPPETVPPETVPPEIVPPETVPPAPENIDTPAPVNLTISDPIVTDRTASTAVITWRSDAPYSLIEYGTTTSYGRQLIPYFGSNEYSAPLSNLKDNTTYHFRIVSFDDEGNTVRTQDHTFLTQFSVPTFGATSRVTDATGPLVTSYTRISKVSGSAPAGLTVTAYRHSNVLLNEFASPATSLLSSGRTFLEVSADGVVNTGIIVTNTGTQDATLNFDLRDDQGTIFKTGVFVIKSTGNGCSAGVICGQLSSFVDEWPFLSDHNFRGTLTFTSSTPVSFAAVRAFHNEVTPAELILTNQPIVDLSRAAESQAQVIPHVVLGGGFTTQLVLVNPTGAYLQGTVHFTDSTGTPMFVKAGTWEFISDLPYELLPNGAQSIAIPEGLLPWQVGSIWVTPGEGSPAPAPYTILNFRPAGFAVAEAIVPPTMGSSFRVYAEASNSPQINTQVTVANATDRQGIVTFSLTDFAGRFVAQASSVLTARSQLFVALDSMIPPSAGSAVRGVLRVTTDLPAISVTAFRMRYNERQPVPDFIFTTIVPVAENSSPASEERVFPQVVYGDGISTEIILYSGDGGESSEGNLDFFGIDGAPIIPDIQ